MYPEIFVGISITLRNNYLSWDKERDIPLPSSDKHGNDR